MDIFKHFYNQLLQAETETKKREQETESRHERIDQIKQEARETEKLNVAPEKPVRNSILKAKVALVEPEIDQTVSDDDSDQFATIKRFRFCHFFGGFRPECAGYRSPKDPSVGAKQEETKADFVEQTVQMLEQDFVDEYIYGIGKGGYKARALYDYQAGNYSFLAI